MLYKIIQRLDDVFHFAQALACCCREEKTDENFSK